MDRLQQLAGTGLFDVMVPRYTSYPTAPHFGSATDSETTDRWLRGLPQAARLSLYLHIPFCERLCWFCACRTQGVRSPEPVAAYLEVLKAEIDMVAARVPESARVIHVHWGGGTPTILTPAQIEELAAHLAQAFSLDAAREFAVEIDPTVTGPDRIAALARAGMTRASIGIQDFDPEIQKAIGRHQSFEQTAEAVRHLRAHGIESLNTDIVYGLPNQTLTGIADSTAKVLELAPDRVALFGYAHVPWAARRQRVIDANALPDAPTRLALMETAEAMFLEAGYDALGIDHYAKPSDALAQAAAEGRMRRNFQGYTDDGADALIGLGASAISLYPGGFVQNASATAAYTGRIRAHALATSRGHALGIEDRLRGALIERLLCDLSVDLAALGLEFGSFAELLDGEVEHALERFRPWLTRDGDRLVLAPEGKPIARLVAGHFDAYLRTGTARHSRAI